MTDLPGAVNPRVDKPTTPNPIGPMPPLPPRLVRR